MLTSKDWDRNRQTDGRKGKRERKAGDRKVCVGDVDRKNGQNGEMRG